MKRRTAIIDLGGSDAMEKKLNEVVIIASSQLVARQTNARNAAFDRLLLSATNQRDRARLLDYQALVDRERTAILTLAIDVTGALANEIRDKLPSSWQEGFQRAFRRLGFAAVVR